MVGFADEQGASEEVHVHVRSLESIPLPSVLTAIVKSSACLSTFKTGYLYERKVGIPSS